MHKYCVIKETQSMRNLLSIIKANYRSECGDTIVQEVNLEHVLNRIDNKDIRTLVKSGWHDIETILGYEMRLLEMNAKKSIFSKLNRKSKDMYFIAKVRADETSTDIFKSIFNASNLKVELMEIKI
ncbi:normocyte binding protein 2b [Francisella sp. SYW-9]|uniref:normocyte binding protein 2b n=1 Tax=Francisella sp. SYW-9 TaxID=2610888 RepID=UPI00123DD110|nr:normocyte binding protein 2b [Francisella sp. SYW-9]